MPRSPTCLTLLILLAGPVAAETYVYQESDGTRWITDRKMDPNRFTFIDKYGRPSATRSCKGVTAEILESRAGLYMRQVHRHAREHTLDPRLIKAMITVESCFDRTAVSRAGAHGLMQLMPATARRYGVLDRFDAAQNLRAGITHFRDLMDEFGDDLRLSLAAYNAGAHNVKKYRGIPPFRETQGYVKKVLNWFERFRSQQPDEARLDRAEAGR